MNTDCDLDCPRCDREVCVLDLCECDHETGPYCGPCCRREHKPEETA